MALLRSIATVGGYTIASRVLGFVRDILIARLLGAGMIADAFFVALRFPNLFRSLFAEGAFNASFVPLFGRRLEDDGRAAARRFAEDVLAVLLSALLAFTVLAQIAMPWLMYAIAPGFADTPAKFDLAVQFTRITFPYLLFMSLTALQGGVLNSLHRFAAAAAAPILLNVVMILALVVVVPLTGQTGHVLAWAVSVAGLGQFLLMVAACRRAGILLARETEEFFDGIEVLARLGRRLPRDGRVAILTISGGPSVIASDACEEAGLAVPPLPEPVRTRRPPGLPFTEDSAEWAPIPEELRR